MVYESSYESGHQPFLPDIHRGLWSKSSHFIYAALSIAFKFDIYSISWYFMDPSSSLLYSTPVYLLCLVLYVIPLMVIQAFLGQFSSSGFISVLRITPLFKGIGYVSLALNTICLIYSSVFATIPLAYFFASMHPTLPWDCERFNEWAHHVITEEDEHDICHVGSRNVTQGSFDNTTDFINHHIPSVLYFRTLFDYKDLFLHFEHEYYMSWQLILCHLFVWCLIALFYYKCRTIEQFGKCLHYVMIILITLLVVLVIRFSFLPGAGYAFERLFSFSIKDFIAGITVAPMYTLIMFGPGWGLFITLASFNRFNTNIVKTSWWISFGQLGIMIGLDMLAVFTESHFSHITDGNYYTTVDYHWLLYLSSGSVIANMVWPNFWSLLFYFMLFLSSITVMITQLYSMLISVFDELVILRAHKLNTGLGAIVALALFSLYFTSNDGVLYFTALTSDASITQTILNLLLILVVCWIYGRERLQRDMEFMVGERFATWKVNMLRFVAPLALLIILLLFIMVSVYEHMLSTWPIRLLALVFILLPWLCVPAYSAFCIWQITGTIKMRLKKCCRPTDWYPVKSNDRQRYEEAMNNMDITHQLNEITEDIM